MQLSLDLNEIMKLKSDFIVFIFLNLFSLARGSAGTGWRDRVAVLKWMYTGFVT